MSLTVKSETLTCPSCFIPFSVPARAVDDRCSGKVTAELYCPNGHTMTWSKFARSKLEEMERRAEQAEASLERHKRYLEEEREAHIATDRRLSATRGVVTRLKRRAGKGVCPCCNRTFANLRRHMESKHPGFAEEPAP